MAPHNVGLNLPSEVWKAVPLFLIIKGSLEGYCNQRCERHLRHLAGSKSLYATILVPSKYDQCYLSSYHLEIKLERVKMIHPGMISSRYDHNCKSITFLTNLSPKEKLTIVAIVLQNSNWQ